MSDQQITCSECGGSFVFTESERQFYESKGLTGPKRCKPCRQARKAADGGRGGPPARGGPPGRGGARDFAPAGRGARGPGGPGGAPRGGFDRARAASPVSRDSRDSRDGAPPAPGGWGRLGGGGNDRRPSPPARDGYARPGRPAFPPGEARSPRDGGPASRARHDAPRTPRTDASPARRHVVDAPPELRPRRRRDAEPAPAPAGADAPRAAKKKPERPKYDVTCVQCGVAAQVPFKPIEGRDIFCQPCYQARGAGKLGAPAPHAEPQADAGTDAAVDGLD